MYQSEVGYAEIFDISDAIMKHEEEKAAAIQLRLDHLKGLSLPFANSAVLNCSIAVGGSWAERHPPICPLEMQAQIEELEARKKAESERLMKPEEKQGVVIALKL